MVRYSSLTRFQNGSKYEWAGDRPYHGPGVIVTSRVPLEMAHSSSASDPAHVRHRNHGRRVDPVLVVETPILVDPSVEAVEELVE